MFSVKCLNLVTSWVKQFPVKCVKESTVIDKLCMEAEGPGLGECVEASHRELRLRPYLPSGALSTNSYSIITKRLCCFEWVMKNG